MPSRRRQQAHRAMQESLDLGDEVITAGGLHAVIRELGEDELRVEIAPDVLVTLDRRAVAAVAREVEETQMGQEETQMGHGEGADPG